MKVIEIKLEKDPYKILYTDVANGVATIIPDCLSGKRAAIISDEGAAKNNISSLKQALSKFDVEIIEIILPPGEKNKELKVAERIIDLLLSKKFERQDVIIGLGGGVIGDLSGFVAGIIHRGVKFINIPTTLLAQVDSSIGGKTGVNNKYGKNLIGCFKQPEAVICDTNLLSTLPRRELLSGYSELVKHALIGDAELFGFLQSNTDRIFKNNDILHEAVNRSALVKANIVMKDTHEENVRAHLNLGHTFGHAIESFYKYDGRLIHGEAISIGMVMAFKTAVKLEICDGDNLNIIQDHFDRIGLLTSVKKVNGDKISSKRILDLMKRDKKVTNGMINLILPRKIGDVEIQNNIEENIITDILRECFND